MSWGALLERSLVRHSVTRYAENSPVLLGDRQSGMEVEVRSEGWAVTVVSLQRAGHPNLVRAPAWKALCDYLLMCEREDRRRVVLVELKRTFSDDSKPLEQLRRSLPLWRYLEAAGSVEDESAERAPAIPVRYAAIYARRSERLPKTASRRWPKPGRDRLWRGVRVREIVAGSVPLSHLTESPAAEGAEAHP